MVSLLNYSTYSEVMDSWERIRRVQNYDKTLGVIVFQKFISIHPSATQELGLGEEEEYVNSGSFKKHAKKFVGFCDSFMDMLGPDADMLSDILEEEGTKHAKYGIKVEHYPALGDALIEGVRTLDKKFNDDTELCWRQVYGGVTHDMSRANIYAKAGRRRTI